MCLWNMHLDFFTVCLDVCQWISKIVLWWLGGDFGGKLRWFHGEIGRPPSQNQPSQGHSPLYLQSSLLLWSLQCHYIFQEVLYLFHFIVGSWQKWWCCSPHSRWQTFIFFLKKEVWKPRLLRRDEALLSANLNLWVSSQLMQYLSYCQNICRMSCLSFIKRHPPPQRSVLPSCANWTVCPKLQRCWGLPDFLNCLSLLLSQLWFGTRRRMLTRASAMFIPKFISHLLV